MQAPEYDPDYSEKGAPVDDRLPQLCLDIRRVPPQGRQQATGH